MALQAALPRLFFWRFFDDEDFILDPAFGDGAGKEHVPAAQGMPVSPAFSSLGSILASRQMRMDVGMEKVEMQSLAA